MEIPNTLSAREIQTKDIDLITDYWLKSDPDFLISLGVDLDKLPSQDDLRKMLINQIATDIRHKHAYALIWELNGKPVGHSNVNGIYFGVEATLHFHIWQSTNRGKGLGTEFVKKSLPFYFENLELEELICEPYALNPAPHKTLEKVGFVFLKRYTTVPGSLNFEQEVCLWEMSRDRYLERKD